MTTPWHTNVLRLVSQLSARVFLGAPLCRNETWLQISVRYTVAVFTASTNLRAYNPVIRPFVYNFMRDVREVKKLHKAAVEIIEPEFARRRAIRKEEEQNPDRKIVREKPVDSMQWLDEITAKRGPNHKFDVVSGQLGFTVAAIHTTSSGLSNAMFDLIAHPELLADVRAEIISVLGPDAEDGGGWKKTSLYKLRLLDSCIKESQRLNPVNTLLMKRIAMKAHTFSDGTSIPAGAPIAVPTSSMRDPSIFPDPLKYDGYRFLRLRQEPGNENRWQFVTTAPEMFGFGHGTHACPGRFFASNEMKIALIHLLMKYEWRFAGEKQGIEGRPKTILRVDQLVIDTTVCLEYKSRKSEIEF